MACLLYELVNSRDLDVSTNSEATFAATFLARGTTNEAEVYAASIAQTPRSYFGLIRQSVNIKNTAAADYWDVTVNYRPLQSGEALGEEPENPPSPGPNTPLGPGYGFSTGSGSVHITQSLETIASYARDLAANPPDNKGAIGVTRQGIEGCEIQTGAFEFSIEVTRPTVTMNYVKSLAKLTNPFHSNDADFRGWAAGEVLYLGCDGSYTVAEKWKLTHKFGVSINREDLTIAGFLDVGNNPRQFSKKGWEYLWVAYGQAFSEGVSIKVPKFMYIEKVYPTANFSILGIGV